MFIYAQSLELMLLHITKAPHKINEIASCTVKTLNYINFLESFYIIKYKMIKLIFSSMVMLHLGYKLVKNGSHHGNADTVLTITE